jgi:hypothetical protein
MSDATIPEIFEKITESSFNKNNINQSNDEGLLPNTGYEDKYLFSKSEVSEKSPLYSKYVYEGKIIEIRFKTETPLTAQFANYDIKETTMYVKYENNGKEFNLPIPDDNYSGLFNKRLYILKSICTTGAISKGGGTRHNRLNRINSKSKKRRKYKKPHK